MCQIFEIFPEIHLNFWEILACDILENAARDFCKENVLL